MTITAKIANKQAAPLNKNAAKPTASAPVKTKPAQLVQPADQAVEKALRSVVACLIMTTAVVVFVFSSNRTDLLQKIDHAGQIAPLQALPTPNLGSDAVINWAKLAVSEIFTYKFTNVRDRMNRASRYFTPEGWEGFVLSAQESGLLRNVTAQQQFVTTVPTTAVISAEYDGDNRHYWIVQVSILTSVYTGGTGPSAKGGLTLKIAQIPTNESWAGYAFGITQITK